MTEHDLPDADNLVAEQIAYYRARAPEYDDWWLRTGRYAPDDDFGRRWEAAKRDLEEALRAFRPAGDVLELAAGTGNLTRQLLAQPGVTSVTALDASQEALDIARSKVRDERVTFEVADLFRWTPPRRYDVIAFGFWLSHVPPARFDEFWALVDRAAETDGGRLFFVDSAAPVEPTSGADRTTETPGSTTWLDHGVARRTLADGRAFHIVKRTWRPDDLEAELAERGWTASVRETRQLFVHASARRRTSRR